MDFSFLYYIYYIEFYGTFWGWFDPALLRLLLIFGDVIGAGLGWPAGRRRRVGGHQPKRFAIRVVVVIR